MVTWLQVAAQLLLERWKCRLEILFMLSAARRGSHQKCFGWSLLILSPCSECVIFFLREHPSQMCRIKRGFGWPVIRLVGGKTWPQLRRWIPWNKWHRPSVESKPGMICSENAIAPTYAILLHFMLSSYGSPRRLHWGSASDAQRCQCADFIFELTDMGSFQQYPRQRMAYTSIPQATQNVYNWRCAPTFPLYQVQLEDT